MGSGTPMHFQKVRMELYSANYIIFIVILAKPLCYNFVFAQGARCTPGARIVMDSLGWE